jgi:hypothetical protein
MLRICDPMDVELTPPANLVSPKYIIKYCLSCKIKIIFESLQNLIRI